MRKLNPNIHAHVPTEPEVKLAMIRKLEAELRNFKTDSEGTRSNLENAIKDLSSKWNEDNVKYLPRLVKSRRNHVVHLNTKALIFARSHLWKAVCGLLQFKLRICGWQCWHGDMQQMLKCRAKQRGDWCRMTTCSVANWMPGWTLAARLWDLWTSAALQNRAELWGWAWLDLNITWHEECHFCCLLFPARWMRLKIAVAASSSSTLWLVWSEVFWWHDMGQWENWVHQTREWGEHIVLCNFQPGGGGLFIGRRIRPPVQHQWGISLWSNWEVHDRFWSFILNCSWNCASCLQVPSFWTRWDAFCFPIWAVGTWHRLWTGLLNAEHRRCAGGCRAKYGRHRERSSAIESVWFGDRGQSRRTKLPGAIQLAICFVEPLATSWRESYWLHRALWRSERSVQSGAPGWGKTNRYCYADLEWVCRHTHKMQHTYVL